MVVTARAVSVSAGGPRFVGRDGGVVVDRPSLRSGGGVVVDGPSLRSGGGRVVDRPSLRSGGVGVVDGPSLRSGGGMVVDRPSLRSDGVGVGCWRGGPIGASRRPGCGIPLVEAGRRASGSPIALRRGWGAGRHFEGEAERIDSGG